MNAVVMAGGQGTRLRPLTSNQPKPMLPILGQPMMQHVVRLARSHGLTDVVATVQFLASIIRNYLGDGSDLGVDLHYVTENEPLGTAGSVKNAERLLDERFVILSGDSLTDVDLTELVKFHESKGAAITVTLKQVPDPLEFGIVIADDDGRIDRFLEKPGWGEVFSDTINTGIYVMEREVLSEVPDDEEFDFSKDLFPKLLERGVPMYGYVTDRYWTDVGTLETYMAAQRAALDRDVDIEIDGFEMEGGIWLGEGAEVDPDAVVRGPVYVGADARVEAGATIREYTVLGRGAVVKSGSSLHRAVVHDYAYVGGTASLRGCVLGKNSDVKYGARLEEGVVVADACHVGEGAVINPHVKVYPFKTVDPGAVVSSSIIWESAGRRALFGELGVTGLLNVDISPEMAVRLALAYASILPKGTAVVACRDATKGGRLIKRTMVAGINAGGLACHDLELVPIPVARFYARSARALAGFSVRSAPRDPASVVIQFFDERGVDIDGSTQRQLERAFYRDDLRRAFHHDIGELTFPARGREYYVRGLLDSIDVGVIRMRSPKVVVDYAYGGTAVTGAQVLGRIGGDVLGLNAVLDPDRVVISEEQEWAHLENVRRLVLASGAEVGALFDSPGERLWLVDGRGRILQPRTAMLAVVWLVANAVETPRVALPVSATREAARIVRDRGGDVVWTRISPADITHAADSAGVVFAGGVGGGYVFPQFMPALDGVMSLAKILELTARLDTSLADVVDQLPEFHVTRLEVPVPWEAKGTVMRRLIERFEDDSVQTVDGVKTYRGRDWALIVPHPLEPVVRVWAESDTADGAGMLAMEMASLVEEVRA
ncbi:MAG: sugar phosphate nucleotidyltransferase [Actinomycetota bacterium]